jgi:DNA-binding response OmpR family regulator
MHMTASVRTAHARVGDADLHKAATHRRTPSVTTAHDDLPVGARPDRGSPRTVLVVEDHESLRESTIAILRLEGFSTVGAADGEAALDALQEHQIDVVLLDLSLPCLDGPGVLEAVDDPPPVVVISGFRHVTEKAIRAQFGSSVVECLHKPVSPRRLVAATTAALAIAS